MPWKEQTIVSQREEFAQLALQEGANISHLCQEFGISRPTGYKWIERHQQGEALADRSKRPYNSPNKTKANIEEQVINVRLKHSSWGGRKIFAYLRTKGFSEVPRPSTITEILRRNNLINPEESIKHKAFERFEMAEPNELWQMDFKGYFGMAIDGYCHPLTVLDDHSRFLLVLKACRDQTTQTVQKHLTQVFREHGMPQRMLMDNGSPWKSPERGYTALTVWFIRLGILISHGRPRHPQTQGKEERLHRTLNDELLRKVELQDLNDCQRAFDKWRFEYNYERPHDSLDLATPGTRYRESARPFPEKLPIVLYDDNDIVRKVDAAGRVYFKNRIFKVGKAFINQPVALRPSKDDGVYDVYYCDQKVAKLNLLL